MMRKKELRFLVVFLVVLVASFFVPLTAMAADGDLTIESDDISLSTETCSGGNCHHTIKGASTGGTIKVASGTHVIELDNVKIGKDNIDGCAFEIGWNANVTLILKGTSTLSSNDGYAGIYVAPLATLKIQGEGTLNVTGGKEGAGIGGQKSTAPGKITIEGGTVNATGGTFAAGIGGGSESGFGTINLTGGKVTAKGGDAETGSTQDGGPGIGYGSLSANKTGKITITHATVTATGGKNTIPNYPTIVRSIACADLSSGGLSANNVSIDGIIDVPPGNIGEFNGIVGSSNSNSYTVYGDAVVDDISQGPASGNIDLGAGNSLTINTTGVWGFGGSITGSGTIYNAEKLGSIGISSSITKCVELQDGAIEVKNVTYTGYDLTEEAIIIAEKTEAGDYTINQEGWVTEYLCDGKKVDGVKEAGQYTVTWKKDNYKEIRKPVSVYPKAITEDMISGIEDQTYTGAAIEPLEIIDYDILDDDGNGYKLVVGKDYTAEYQNNTIITAPEQPATVGIKGTGNYTTDGGSIGTLSFNILAADFMDKATVTVKLANPTYNGLERKDSTVNVTVTLEGNTEPLGRDEYNVESISPQPIRNAGTYTVAVEAQGKNCTGTATGAFEMLPKPLTATTAEAVNREYDGGTEVRITSVGLGGILPKDDGKVAVDTSKVSGDIDEPGNAGSYKFAALKNLALVGSEASNYSIEETQSGVPLNPAVEIAKAKPPAPILEGVCKASDEIKDKFTYTLSIKNEAKGVKYVYWMDTGKEQESPVFDGLDPGSKHTFYARAVESNNVEASEKGTTGEVTIDKLTQKAPGSFTLTFTDNGDGTFTAVIPTGENTEYSFDGINWSQANTKVDCLPNTAYTGYLRYAEIGDYGASPAVTSTQTTPKVAAAQPVISPEGGAFINEQTVSITTTTADAVIYYTTDGTVPTAQSKKYTGPFKIDETMTIKAIAIKGGMENSSVASADFELATGDMLQTKLTTKRGVVVSAELKKTKYNTKDKITSRLSRVLTSNTGYNYLNIEYYDISIQMSVDGKKWQKATPENFPAEGLTITMNYPQGTSMEANDFVAAHMYGETSERLGIKAGEIEEPIVTKTQEGLEFTVTGTSPVGIAWKAAAAGTANNNAGNNANAGNNNNNNGNDGDGARAANAAGDGNGGANDGANGANGAGTAVNGQAANGENANGANANGENAAGESSEEEGLSSLLPQTGDMSSILPWIALAAVSALILIVLGVRRRRH